MRKFLPYIFLVLGAVATTLLLCSHMKIIKEVAAPVSTTSVAQTVTEATTKKEASEEATTEATTKAITTEVKKPSTTLPYVKNSVSPFKEIRTPGVSYCVPYSKSVPQGFFDDVVFVGDSVSTGLKYYCMKNPSLGKATFLTSVSLAVDNSMWDLNNKNAVHPTYKGEKVIVSDGIQKCGKKKVFIMLGINDLARCSVDETFENFKKLTDEILKKSPDVTFYVQSVTPLVKNRGVLTNEKVNHYNARVSSYCRKQKWYFLDVASVFRNQNGALQVKYCSDPKKMGIHFSDEACAIWVKYLYTHSASDGVAVSVPERGRGR